MPASPAKVEIQFDGRRLQISWEAPSSELQPVDSFVVVVQAPRTRGTIERSRRQAQVPSLPEGDLLEFETNDTKLELVITDDSKHYTVSVCSVNGLGRVCSEPQEVVEKIPPTPLSLSGSGVRKAGPSEGLVLAIAVIVPGMILILFIALVAVVIMCKCCSGNGKEYYPSKHGIMTKIQIHA